MTQFSQAYESHREMDVINVEGIWRRRAAKQPVAASGDKR